MTSLIGILTKKDPQYGSDAVNTENARQSYITQGTGDINKAFAGFTPAFYNKAASAYSAYAMPGVNDQFNKAGASLGYGLANRGLLKSSAADQKYFDLAQQKKQAQQGVVDTGIGQSQDLQRTLENQRTALLSQLYQAAAPGGGAQSSIATAAGSYRPDWLPYLSNIGGNILSMYGMQ